MIPTNSNTSEIWSKVWRTNQFKFGEGVLGYQMNEYRQENVERTTLIQYNWGARAWQRESEWNEVHSSLDLESYERHICTLVGKHALISLWSFMSTFVSYGIQFIRHFFDVWGVFSQTKERFYSQDMATFSSYAKYLHKYHIWLELSWIILRVCRELHNVYTIHTQTNNFRCDCGNPWACFKHTRLCKRSSCGLKQDWMLVLLPRNGTFEHFYSIRSTSRCLQNPADFFPPPFASWRKIMCA